MKNLKNKQKCGIIKVFSRKNYNKGGFPMSNMEIVYPTSDVAITEEQAVTMAEFLKERFGNEKNVEFKAQRIVGAENKERWGVYLRILA